MRFGRRLWVCPGGQRPDAEVIGANADVVLLELDPGLAFGTGTHATTALCLEWLDSGAATSNDVVRPWLAGADVIDYGCGSGILAIAALRLGARRAVAMDIDPQALLATRLEEKARRMGAAMEAINRETKENQETLQKRDRALADFTTVFRAVANLTSVLLASGGEDGLAARVRPSARRAGQTEEVANTSGPEGDGV